MPRNLAALGAILIALALAPVTASPAVAQSDDSVVWGVRPTTQEDGARANYLYSAAPGDEIRDAMTVTNHGDHDLTLEVYAADGFLTERGVLDILPASEPSVDLGAWFTFEQSRVTVPAEGSVDVPFTVRVPGNATPGDHTAGVVTSLRNTATADGVDVDRRLGIRFHLRVDGELQPGLVVEQLALGLEPDGLFSAVPTARYRVTNTGNVRLQLNESAGIAAPFGSFGVEASASDPVELLPGSSQLRELPLPGLPALGWVSGSLDVGVTVVGVDEAETVPTPDPVVVDIFGWTAPWVPLTVLVLLLAVLAIVLIAIRRRSRRRRLTGTEPEIPGT